MDTSKAAAALGKVGGKAGTGESKVRGDGDYYRALVGKRKTCDRCGKRSRVVAGLCPACTEPADVA